MNNSPKYIIKDKTPNSRPKGEIAKDEFLAFIEKQPPETIIPLSFENVSFLDVSYPDEILCKSIRRIMSGDPAKRYIVVVETNESVVESLDVVLNDRELACVCRQADGTPSILGKLSDQLKETYLFAAGRETVSAKDVSEKFSIPNPSATTNRLTRLEAMALLCKVKEGPGRMVTYKAIR